MSIYRKGTYRVYQFLEKHDVHARRAWEIVNDPDERDDAGAAIARYVEETGECVLPADGQATVAWDAIVDEVARWDEPEVDITGLRMEPAPLHLSGRICGE